MRHDETRTDEPVEQRIRTVLALLAEGRDDEAIKILEPLARSPVPQARLLWGWTFEAGRGRPADLVAAERWYRMAADDAYPPAEFYLAALYDQRGEIEAADELFESAAAQDFAPAHYRLALRSLRRDRNDAAALWRLAKARDAGHLPSAIKLSRLTLESSASPWSKARALWELLRSVVAVISIGTNRPNDERLLR